MDRQIDIRNSRAASSQLRIGLFLSLPEIVQISSINILVIRLYPGPLHSLWTILQAWDSPGGGRRQYLAILAQQIMPRRFQTNIAWCVALRITRMYNLSGLNQWWKFQQASVSSCVKFLWLHFTDGKTSIQTLSHFLPPSNKIWILRPVLFS